MPRPAAKDPLLCSNRALARRKPLSITRPAEPRADASVVPPRLQRSIEPASGECHGDNRQWTPSGVEYLVFDGMAARDGALSTLA